LSSPVFIPLVNVVLTEPEADTVLLTMAEEGEDSESDLWFH